MLSALRCIVSRYDSDDAAARLLYDWRLLAVSVDHLLFWVFVVATLSSTLVTLVLIPLTRCLT